MKFFLEIIKGIFGALLVFLLGFGMMFLLWKVIGNPNDLPGLFYYRAATFGDGICLPILVGSGIVFLQINKQSIGSRKKQGIIF